MCQSADLRRGAFSLPPACLVTCLAACLSLGGCHAGVAYRSTSPPDVHAQGLNMRISLPVDAVIGAALIGAMVSGSVASDNTATDSMSRAQAQPDPARRISVQDCTRPVDTSAGNLVCR